VCPARCVAILPVAVKVSGDCAMAIGSPARASTERTCVIFMSRLRSSCASTLASLLEWSRYCNSPKREFYSFAPLPEGA
jgi:hypothetical protein